MPRGLVTSQLVSVAAAWATERSITTRRARWMIAAGALCGFGFLTKLLAAGIVMPGLWLGYLLAARHPWRGRIVHLLAAAAAFAAVAGVWVGAVQLTPAADRPYIGGSTDGTALDLVLGYNGLGRVTGNEVAGAPGGSGARGGPPPGTGFPSVAGAAGFRVDQFGGTPGIGRLFNNGMGDQVMWLAPAAGLAVAAGAVVALRRRRIDARLGSLVLWAGWAAVTYVLFAFAKGVYHNYYVSLLAPAVAALVGVGASLARSTGRLGRAVVAAGLLATAAVQVVLLRRIPSYAALRWLVPLGLALVAAAWVGLAARRSPVGRRAMVGALVAGAGVALVAPGVWAVNGVRTAQSGTFPDARPALAGGAQGGPGGGFPGGFGGAGGAGGAGGLTDAMLAWLRGQRTTEWWIVAVSSSMQADAAIIDGDSVMPIGGFSGGDDSLSAARLADLVERGELRFVLVGGGFGGFGGGAGRGAVTSVVTAACTSVPSSSWGGTGGGVVYDCAGRAPEIRAAGASPSASRPAATGQPTGAGAQPAGAGAQPAGFEQFASCMQANGVTLTVGGPPNLADAAVANAMRACAAYAPGR